MSLKSKVFLLFLFLLIFGCQSTVSFYLKTIPSIDQNKVNDLHVIEAGSNRIVHQCLFLNAEAENNWRHQYFMYILNDKNEVIEIMQPTNQDKDSCYVQLNKIEKILKSKSNIKICARDELKIDLQNTTISFGVLGSHKVSYEALTLDRICGAELCFKNEDIWSNSCPYQ